MTHIEKVVNADNDPGDLSRGFSAGELIVAEAGGEVEELRNDRGVSIVADNPTLVGAMRQYVR